MIQISDIKGDAWLDARAVIFMRVTESRGKHVLTLQLLGGVAKNFYYNTFDDAFGALQHVRSHKTHG